MARGGAWSGEGRGQGHGQGSSTTFSLRSKALEFTFVAPQGSSVIDYVIIPLRLKPIVIDFQVGDITISDHLPLILKIDLELSNRLIPSGSRGNVEISLLK